MTELPARLGGIGGASGDDTAAAAETAADSGNGLTEAEQAGIAQLEGVLSSAALAEALRSEAAYGLDGYALASASYTLVEARGGGEEGQGLCALYSVASGGGYRPPALTLGARPGAGPAPPRRHFVPGAPPVPVPGGSPAGNLGQPF